MPAPLYSKFMKHIYLAIAIFVIGIIIAFTGGNPTDILGSLIPTTGVSLILILMAFWFKMKVTRQGYLSYIGTCTQVNSVTVGLKSKTVSYLIETDDGYYELPAIKLNVKIPEGAKVEFYSPKNVMKYESNGVTKLTEIWTYRLVN